MPGGNYLGAGIEHNERGAPTASGAMHARDEREALPQARPAAQRRATCSSIDGDPRRAARAGQLGQHAPASAARRSRCARAEGLRGQAARALRCSTRWPRRSTADFFASVRAGLVVEQSHQGQLYRILRMFVDVPARRARRSRRSGANPFQPREVVDRLRAGASAAGDGPSREPRE